MVPQRTCFVQTRTERAAAAAAERRSLLHDGTLILTRSLKGLSCLTIAANKQAAPIRLIQLMSVCCAAHLQVLSGAPLNSNADQVASSAAAGYAVRQLDTAQFLKELTAVYSTLQHGSVVEMPKLLV